MKNSVRFTERASGAIAAARDASASLGHSYVGTEHLLLGVAAETESLGARVLRGRGLDMLALTQLVESESGSGSPGAPEQGLTPLGRRFLARMEELGIFADVSHLSEAGFWDVAEQARRPVLATHSNAKSVWGHTRNLTDGQITAIIKLQGIIGLNFYREFVGLGRDLDAVRAHLDHILELGGADCVALGGDWDGCDTIADLPDLPALDRFYEYLLRCRYGEPVVRGLFYHNLMRVVSCS